jgi:hypothetical protein
VNSATFSSFPRSAFRPKGLICKAASGASRSANPVDDFMSTNMKIRSSSAGLWYFPVRKVEQRALAELVADVSVKQGLACKSDCPDCAARFRSRRVPAAEMAAHTAQDFESVGNSWVT